MYPFTIGHRMPFEVRAPSRARFLGRRLLAGALLLLLCSPIFLYRLGRAGLEDPDEGRNSEVAREMLESGDWITPRINGARYLDKPPAYFWTVALSYRLFGVNEQAARLPSAIFALAGVGLTAWFGRRHLGPRAGWLAGIVLALSPLYIVFGRTVIFDMMLTFFMTAAAMAAFEAMEGDGRHARLAGIAFFAFAAAGTLTKGPVALAAPLLVAAAWAVLTRRPALILRLGWGTGTIVYAAIVLPWLFLIAWRNPGYLEYAIVGESLQRAISNRFNTARPFYFYAKVLIPGFFPWILYCCAAAGRRALRPAARPEPGESPGRQLSGRRVLATFRDAARSRPALAYSGLWLAVLVLFFSCVASKRPSYILPCAVPIALLTADLWARALAVRGAGGPEADARRATAREDLSAGALLAAVSCVAAAFALALASPLGLAFGVSGGDYDALLSRRLLFGTTAAGLAALAALLLLTRRLRRPLLGLGLAILAIGAMIPLAHAVSGHIDASGSSRPVSRFLAARLRPADRVVCFDHYRPGLNFYLRRPIDLVDEPGRTFTSNYIKFNREAFEHDPSFRVLPEEEMRALLRRNGSGTFLLVPWRAYEILLHRAGVPLREIYADSFGPVLVRSDAAGAS